MKVVNLQVYKGSKVLYTAERTVENQNQSVKLIHGTLEWKNYMKHLDHHGYCLIEVNSVKDEKGKELDKSEIEEEVAIAHRRTEEKALTPEQKEIASLKAQMAELVGTKKEKVEVKVEVKKETKVDDSALTEARARYKETFNKNAHHKMTVESINKAIETK